MKDWNINNRGHESRLFHRSKYHPEGLYSCKRLYTDIERTTSIWYCPTCSLVAPEEIAFAADLAKCESTDTYIMDPS